VRSADDSVLANDRDGERQTLSVVVVRPPWHGALTLAADGLMTYMPLAGFIGSDTFTYRVTDGNTFSPVAVVTIDVSPASQPAAPQQASGDIDGDGDVDQTDVRAAMKLIGQRVAGAGYLGSADVNGDGRITVADIVAVRNRIGVATSVATAPVLRLTSSGNASLVRRSRRGDSRAPDALPTLVPAAVDQSLIESAPLLAQLSAARRRARETR
jgi:hypothetical protein